MSKVKFEILSSKFHLGKIQMVSKGQILGICVCEVIFRFRLTTSDKHNINVDACRSFLPAVVTGLGLASYV